MLSLKMVLVEYAASHAAKISHIRVTVAY